MAAKNNGVGTRYISEAGLALGDSGIDFKLSGLKNENENTTATKSDWNDNREKETKDNQSYSDAMAEIILNRKKLKESETQVTSLTLILKQSSGNQNSNGIDVVALEKSKRVLEGKVQELKQNIYKKELELGKQENCFQEGFLETGCENDESRCINEMENGQISGNWDCSKETLCLSFVETDGITRKVDEWLDANESSERSESGLDDSEIVTSNDNSFSEYVKEENTRLRQKLSEARKKHKAERERVIEQLRMLEIEAVNGERNWIKEVRKKQLNIEELSSRNQELLVKNEELTAGLKDSEKLMKKELKESDSKTKKKEKIIAKLKMKLANVEEEKGKLEEDLKKLYRDLDDTKANAKHLMKRNEDLQHELREKNQIVEETNAELEKHSKAIDEMGTKIKNLQSQVSRLREDKQSLNEQIEVLTNGLEIEKLKVIELEGAKRLLQKRFVSVGLQTDEDFENMGNFNTMKQNMEDESRTQLNEAKNRVKSLTDKEDGAQNEMTALKEKIFQKEHIIQELTNELSQNKLEHEERSSGQPNAYTEVIQKSSNSMLGIMDKVKAELASVQEDVTRHKENVETMGYRWRRYKTFLHEINQRFAKKT